LHTPLSNDGAYPSYQLINAAWLAQAKPGLVLLNAGRGAVIDSRALKQAESIHYCLDVWEHEPDIDRELVNHALLATPHVAGYAEQAKQRGSFMIYNAVARHFRLARIDSTNYFKDSKQNPVLLTKPGWEQRVLLQFDPRLLTQALQTGADFDVLRGNAQSRQEFII